jgi:predicted transcriptional regulator
MQLRREHRDREDTQRAVLEALADRHAEGMTVFELRSVVDTDIDDLERALSGLQQAGLVSVEDGGERTVFVVASEAIEPETAPETEPSFFEWLKGRLGF